MAWKTSPRSDWLASDESPVTRRSPGLWLRPDRRVKPVRLASAVPQAAALEVLDTRRALLQLDHVVRQCHRLREPLLFGAHRVQLGLERRNVVVTLRKLRSASARLLVRAAVGGLLVLATAAALLVRAALVCVPSRMLPSLSMPAGVAPPPKISVIPAFTSTVGVRSGLVVNRMRRERHREGRRQRLTWRAATTRVRWLRRAGIVREGPLQDSTCSLRMTGSLSFWTRPGSSKHKHRNIRKEPISIRILPHRAAWYRRYLPRRVAPGIGPHSSLSITHLS